MGDSLGEIMTQNCFKEVSDFEEKVKNGELNIVFLYDNGANPKHPVGGKYAYKSYNDIIDPANENRNLGIGLPKQVTDDVFLCVIDIDGDSGKFENIQDIEETKVGTRQLLFDVIKEKMKDYGLNPMYVTTASNGFHIYIYVTQSTHKQHGFNRFSYPKQDIINNKLINTTAVDDYPILQKLLGRKMGGSSIEIFTQGSYVVAPGSVINGNKYRVLPDGAQKFEDISVYGTKPIQELLKDILMDSFFTFEESLPTLDYNYEIQNENHDLLPRNIKAIGNLIIKAWPLIDGQKQEATLALGGFLYKMNVSEKSIMDIGNYVIDNKNNPHFFKQSDEVERTSGFMTSLLHDSKEKAEDKKTNGLTFLKSLFEGKMPTNELSKVLWLNTRPSSHSFLPNGSFADEFEKIKIDFEHKNISHYDMRKGKWNDEIGGYEPPSIKKNKTIHHCLDNFEYIDDISSPYESDMINKKISFTTTNELQEEVKHIFQNTQDMFRHYSELPGAHIKHSEIVLRHIINEYERIGLIEEVEGSSNPGIYLSRDETKMRKFIRTKGGIEEVEPRLPSKEELTSALQLLSQINDVYPWEDDKFGVFIKLGLILPYGYIFKNHFNDFFRGIILYGEAGTLKSTSADLIESISVPQECIKLHKKWYITSGSDLRTEFRIGRALDRHSYPIVVNECEGTFSDVNNRELIKNAISDLVVREPGGDNPQTYYSRGIPILTANELPSAVETSGISRRFLVLNFIEKERGDIPEVIEKMQFLNENGKRNSRFKELICIGDFVFYTLSNHLEYFYSTPQEIADKVIKDMIDYTGLPLKWLLEPKFEEHQKNDREEESQTELEMTINVIKKPFIEKKTRFFGRNISEEKILESMLGNDYSYIYRVKNRRSNGIIITSLIKDEVSKRYYNYTKSISSKRLAELMNAQLNLENEVFYASNKITCVDGSRKRGIFIEWGDFCNIMGLDADMETEIDLSEIS